MTTNNHIRTFCTLGLCFILSLAACKDNSKATTPKATDIPFTKEGTLQIVKAETDSTITTLDIEVADDSYQIQTGLMYRNELKPNHGMLFVFPQETNTSFYMKNTRIALDIIYIAKDSTIVNIQKNAVPFDETSLPSSAPVQYVLEVNAGLSEQWGLGPGDKIRFEILD